VYQDNRVVEKRKKLWGSKKNTPVTEVPWNTANFQDPEREKKFLKLIGMKDGDVQNIQKQQHHQPPTTTPTAPVASTEKMWSDLEKQYQQGLIYNMPDQRKGLK